MLKPPREYPPAFDWKNFQPADDETIARLRREMVGDAPVVPIRTSRRPPAIPEDEPLNPKRIHRVDTGSGL